MPTENGMKSGNGKVASHQAHRSGGQEGIVRVGPLMNIEPVITQLGFDPEPVFSSVGIRREVFHDPDHRVSYLLAGKLIAAAAAQTGCEHFGLLVGHASQPSHLGVAGFLSRAASNTRQALTVLVENLDLHDNGGTPTLNIRSDYAELGFSVHQPGVAALDHIYDLCAAIMNSLLRSLCGDDWKASEVFLPRRRPADIKPYKRLFCAPILFDADRCAINFSAYCLDQRAPTADSLLYRHLEKEAKALHEIQAREVTDTLPAVLRQGLLANQYSAEKIAAVYGLQTRTFHRRLQAAGTTFREELDQARKTLSQQLLEITGMPVCDIAHSLGYSDASGFIRAFHRWSGVSPANWRRNNAIH